MLARDRHLHGRFPRRHHLRRLVALLLLLLLTVAGAATYYAQPRRLAAMTGDYLSRLLDVVVQIDSARIRLDGAIALQRVRLTIPQAQGERARLFEADELLVRHDLLKLLVGRFEPQSLTFLGPRIFLTEDLDSRQSNIQLLAQRRTTGGMSTRLGSDLPDVFVRDGQVTLAEIRGPDHRVINRMDVEGHLASDSDQPGTYAFWLREQAEGSSTGVTLHGGLDLRRLAVDAWLEGFSFDGPYASLLPRDYRHWWQQLDPSGTLTSVHLGYDPDPSGGYFAELSVKDASLTLPYTESLARMTVQDGVFRITQRGIAVRKLRGRVEGMDYVIDGRAEGLSPVAPMTLSVRITGVIPAEPRYLPWFPLKVQEAFTDFKPAGRCDIMVLIRREQEGGELTYDGRIAVADASLKFYRFPYQLHDVSGEMRFTEDHLRVELLRGTGPTGGIVTIRGVVDKPGRGGEANITVACNRLPLDEAFCLALKDSDQHEYRELFSETEYVRLSDPATGVLLPTADRKALEQEVEALQKRIDGGDAAAEVAAQLAGMRKLLARPGFDVGGTVAVRAEVHRPVGKQVRFESTIHYDLRGVNLLLESWPYPLQILGGTLMMGPDRGELSDVVAVGPRGGRATIGGTFSKVEVNGHRKLVPQVKFVGVDFPIDDLLIASMPPGARQVIRDMHMEGSLAVAGLVGADAEGKVTYVIDLELSKSQVRPFGGAYHLGDVQGHVTIRPGLVTLEQISGRHGNSTLTLRGKVQDLDREPQYQLTLDGKAMRFEDHILDLMAPMLDSGSLVRTLFNEHQPQGEFDVGITLGRDDDGQTRGDLKLRPRQLSFLLRGQRLHFDGVQGEVHARPDRLELTGLRANYGSDGQMEADGRILFTKAGPELDLNFDAANQRFGVTSQTILPPAVRDVIKSLKLDGSYHLEGARLRMRPSIEGQPVLEMTGKLHLRNSVATIGVPITEMDGTLNLDIAQVAGERWPRLKLDLHAGQLRASDRLLNDVAVQMTNSAPARDVLQIAPLNGQCYGGQIFGGGQVNLDDGRWHFRLTLQDVRLGDIVQPRPAGGKTGADHVGPSARLAADLEVAGQGDRPGTRRGRGALTVRDADFYRVPVTMAILQLLNAAPPTARSFSRLSAHYLVEGNLIRFDNLALQSDTIDIEGQGVMKFDTLALNLAMHTRNRAGERLGPVSDLLRVFKDELLGLRVTGTLDKPVVNATSFSGIRRSVTEIFGGDRQPQTGSAKPSEAPDTPPPPPPVPPSSSANRDSVSQRPGRGTSATSGQ